MDCEEALVENEDKDRTQLQSQRLQLANPSLVHPLEDMTLFVCSSVQIDEERVTVVMRGSSSSRSRFAYLFVRHFDSRYSSLPSMKKTGPETSSKLSSTRKGNLTLSAITTDPMCNQTTSLPGVKTLRIRELPMADYSMK
ncbi:phosphatidylethanolamine methyltransferase [Aspergillus luchuensis]|uniref:Phosphatidylethanolamine methyltransferase n=1 Tax=Aspergillus kawachii TaxID=1069201 RepID=A0A146F4I0_ASPKA|nr:phosphatidylethanolamine methyltransferase [Aspergillus luchuensis]